ncbi:hypothetical protein Tco_0200688 [Tanacetum coccineum]
MKMEILLEPTSNKLMVEHAEYDESNTYVLERFNTTAGNPVKKILLKLNLSDHRILKDGGGGEVVLTVCKPTLVPVHQCGQYSKSTAVRILQAEHDMAHLFRIQPYSSGRTWHGSSLSYLTFSFGKLPSSIPFMYV